MCPLTPLPSTTLLSTPCFLTVDVMWPARLSSCQTPPPLQNVSSLTVSQEKPLPPYRKLAIATRKAANPGVVRGLPAAWGRPFFPPPAPVAVQSPWLVDAAPTISMAPAPRFDSFLPLTGISALTRGSPIIQDGPLISVSPCSRQWAACHRTRRLYSQDHRAALQQCREEP